MKAYATIFFIFLKLGFTTIGGGYVMLPILQKELVEKRKWYSEESFVDVLAIAQSSPGPIVVNAAMMIGHGRLGFLGGLLAVFGAVLPAFLTILAVSLFFFHVRENKVVAKAFRGIRPAVVGLIFASAVKLSKISMKRAKKSILITLLSFILISFVGLNPIFALLAGTGLGFFVPLLTREDRQ